jgi:hypothetical protein
MRYDEGLDNDEIASYESKHDITPQKSEVQESTINIEGDFRDMMPTSEEFYADYTP